MSIMQSIWESWRRNHSPRPMPLGRLLPALFLQPKILFVAQQDRWSRAFRVLALISFCCGVAAGASKVPRIAAAARSWAAWFEVQTGGLALDAGKLAWERPAELPHTARHGDWRIDFVPPGTAFPPDFRLGPENRGIWLAADKSYFWWRQQQREELASLPILENGRLWGALDLGRAWPGGLRLRSGEFQPATTKALRQLLPIFLLHQGLSVFFYVMFYTLMFAAVPFIFRSPLAANGFRRLFTFYLYAAIPSVVVATVYASLNLPWLDLPLGFVLTLTAYLLFTYHSVQPPPPQQQRPEGL